MKKSQKLNLIICGCAFVFMIAYVYFIDGIDNIVNSLQKISVGFLFVSVLCMGAYWLLEAACLHVVTKAIYPQQKFKNTFTISVLGQYYNCITPSSSGGQPMQAYYLTKSGTPFPAAMTALLCKFIVYQFTLTIYSVVVLLLRFNYFTNDLGALMALVMIGFIINCIVIVLLLMLAFFKKAVIKCADGVIWLLAKIRILKRPEERKEYFYKQIDDYHENFQFLKKQPVLMLKLFVMTIIQLTIYFSISYVIYLGFNLTGSDFLTIISCQAFVLMISAFMPLPGALGAAEGSYTAFFKNIFTNGTNTFVGVSTFIWRFLTFYLPIIAGLVLSLFMHKIFGDPPEKIDENELAAESEAQGTVKTVKIEKVGISTDKNNDSKK